MPVEVEPNYPPPWVYLAATYPVTLHWAARLDRGLPGGETRLNILGLEGFASDVAVSLVCGMVAAAITFAYRRSRDAYIGRRFPIAGEFRSVFEDLQPDGTIEETKATATLRQRGRKVWGPTWLLGSERGWDLEGTIDNGGRIWGKYLSKDPHDNGLGAFFLELHPDGRLEGMWTGYDSINKTVTSGRYLFSRMKEFRVTQMTPEHVPAALSVLGGALGEKYVTREDLLEFTDNVDKHARVAISRDGAVVGAITLEVLRSPEAVASAFPVDQVARVRKHMPELAFNEVGLVRSVAVSARHRGNGIATRLVKSAVDQLWMEHATCIVSVGWTDDDGCHIEGPLSALGFEERGDLQHYWRDDSIENDYECPTCGHPCECTARLFLLGR